MLLLADSGWYTCYFVLFSVGAEIEQNDNDILK